MSPTKGVEKRKKVEDDGEPPAPGTEATEGGTKRSKPSESKEEYSGMSAPAATPAEGQRGNKSEDGPNSMPFNPNMPPGFFYNPFYPPPPHFYPPGGYTPPVNKQKSEEGGQGEPPSTDEHASPKEKDDTANGGGGKEDGDTNGASSERRNIFPPVPPPNMMMMFPPPHPQMMMMMMQQHQMQMMQHPPSRGVSLFLQCDVEQLSDYQVLVRQQLELFEACPEDVESNTQGRKKPVVLGQVGLRCRHCAALPLRARGRGAVYFPGKLNGIYQAAQNMAGSHLVEACQQIPPNLKHEIRKLRDRRDNASGGKKYWADACRAQYVVETEEGLRFEKPSEDTNV